MKPWWAVNLILVPVGISITLNTSTAEQLQVNVDRWLEVRRPVGQVLYTHAQKTQSARNGIRLQSVGDTITTKKGSSVILAIDIGTGFIKVSENTTIQIRKLFTTSGGGRITQLQVKAGQVRLQVRKFTNSSSSLEIETPAGVAGVRGTDFGVSVQQNGKMGVATLNGGVATNAQKQTVLVNAGFQNLTIPGEPPSSPIPLREDTRLNIRQLIANGNQVRIVGSLDPVNLLTIAKQSQNTDKSGNFNITVPLPANRQVEAVVLTPLGKTQIYQLAIP